MTARTSRSTPVHAHRVTAWFSLVVAVMLLLGNFPAIAGPLPLPLRITPVSAQGMPCVNYDGGTFVSRICITAPADGSTVTGAFTAQVSVTAVSGSAPLIGEVHFYLTPVGHPSATRIAVDFARPYAMVIPSERWVDGPYRLEAGVLFQGGQNTSAQASVFLNLVNRTAAAPHSQGSWAPKTSGASPLHVVVVGDGASGSSGAAAVGSRVSALNPDLFLYLGDVYDSGTYTEYVNYYGPTLGQMKDRTNPVPGNHEAKDQFMGYMDYWDSSSHYYSYDSGGWHFIALDSTEEFGQTGAGSAQYNWLVQDLINNANTSCTAVFFHHAPSASTTSQLRDIWSLLANYGVEIVLAGHSHNYQRWVPMDASGNPDTNGLIKYVVGTGGHTKHAIPGDSRMVAATTTSGVLSMTLGPTGGSTSFVTTAGETLDQTSFGCNNDPTPGNPGPGPVPSDGLYTFLPAADARVQQSFPLANYGNSTLLRTEGGTTSAIESYIGFNVTGLPGTATTATLQVYVPNTASAGSRQGPALYVAESTPWNERGITWDNRPVRVLTPIGTVGAVGSGTWVTYDVSSVVGGNGEYTFVLASSSTDATDLASRETATAPRLVIGGVEIPATPLATPGTPDATPPATPGTPDATPPATPGTPLASPPAGTPLPGTPDATPTPEGTPTPSATATLTPTPTLEPTPTSTPDPTPTSTPEPTPTVPAGPPGSGTYGPVADARVSAGQASTNYGTTTTLIADMSPSEMSYARFNVSGLNGPATSATLRFYVTNATDEGPQLLAVSDTSWSETGVTWNTRPATGAVIGDIAGRVRSGIWIEFDVTAQVTGNGAISFALVGQSPDGIYLSSREGEPAFQPQLIIVGSEPPATPGASPTVGATLEPTTTPTVGPTMTPTSTPTAGPTIVPTATSTAAPTLVPANTPTAAPTLTPTPGPTSGPPDPSTTAPIADARVSAGKASTNYGTDPTLIADLSPVEITYLRFDVQGLSDPAAKATLRLYVTNSTDEGPRLHAIDDTSWTENGITWNNRPATGALIGDISGRVRSGVWIEFDVTSQVTGNGIVSFTLEADSADGIYFVSREGAAGFTPQLVIQPGAPATTPTPEPTGTPSPEPTATSTPEPTPTVTPEPTATSTATPEPTATATPEPTATSTPEPTATATPEPTSTPSPVPTATPTPEPTFTPTAEPTPEESMSITTAGNPSGSEPAAPMGTVVNTGGEGLRCRTGPSIDSEVIIVLADGESVIVRGPQEGDWLPVVCAGQDGYAGAAWIAVETTAVEPTPQQSTTDELPAPTIEATGTGEPAIAPTATVAAPGQVPTTEPTAAVVAPTESVAPTPAPVINGWQENASIPWWWTTDGDLTTMWSGTVTDTADETEFGFDLGSIQPVSHLRMQPTWPMQGTLEIRLSIDGVNWYRLTTLEMNRIVADEWHDIPVATQTRYINFVYTNPAGGSVGAVREMEVWLEPSGYAQPLARFPLVTPEPVPTEPAALPTQPPAPTQPPPPPTQPPVVPTPIPVVPTAVPPTPAPVIPTAEPQPLPTPVPTLPPPPIEPPPPPEEPTPEGG